MGFGEKEIIFLVVFSIFGLIFIICCLYRFCCNGAKKMDEHEDSKSEDVGTSGTNIEYI